LGLIIFLVILELILIQCERDPDPDDPVDIPDSAFLDAIIECGVDGNNDGEISYREAEAVTQLDVKDDGIQNMAGIEAFVNLEDLDCDLNNFRSLKLHSNTKLKKVTCNYNTSLKELDVSKNVALEILGCSRTCIGSPDLSNNINLTNLGLNEACISRLDISHNTALEHLGIVRCQSLGEICVWTMPFPPPGVTVNDYESDHIWYTTDCSF